MFSGMSFDVFLVPLRESDGSERRTAVLRQLARRGIEVDEKGWTTLDTSDGGQADLDVFDETGWGAGFSVYRLSRELAEVVHETALVGELAVVPTMEPPVTLLVDDSHEARVPDDDDERKVAVCPNPEVLHQWLDTGYAAFAGYRGHVLDDDSGT
jgi:hypothetical protein